jgi:GTP-binding protein
MAHKAAADDKEWLKRGQILFAQECKFLRPVADPADLPRTKLPEIAFAGRSNVGKSSLINALTHRKTARVSNMPGRTRDINVFDLGTRLTIADLPGYGFARVSKETKENWRELIVAYLQHRTQLKRVCLLIDARHGAQDNDLAMMTLLDLASAPFHLVLTKIDKLNATERAKAVNDAENLIALHPSCLPELVATSAEKGLGIPELRALLTRVARTPENGYKSAADGRRA